MNKVGGNVNSTIRKFHAAGLQPDLEELFFAIQNKQWKTAPGELQQTSGAHIK